MKFVLEIDIPKTLTKSQVGDLEYLLEHAIEDVDTRFADTPELKVDEKVKELWHKGFSVSIEKMEG